MTEASGDRLIRVDMSEYRDAQQQVRQLEDQLLHADRLVTLGEGVEDTRRRVLQAELEALTPHSPLSLVGEGTGVRAILDAFGRARLLSFDRDPLTRGRDPIARVGVRRCPLGNRPARRER